MDSADEVISARQREISRAVVPGMAFLLLVAFSPTLNHTTWGPRLILAALLAATGLPLLPMLAKSSARAPALVGTTLLVLAVLSAVFADRPWLSLLSSYGNAGSALLVASIVGSWALGTTRDEAARRMLRLAILGGVAVNVVVAWLQAFVDMEPFRLAAPLGSSGLLGNPVHLGALLAGAVALAASPIGRGDLRWLTGVAAIGATLPLSGSRVGAAAALVVAIAMSASFQSLRRAALVLVALLGGFALGEVAQRTAPEAATSTTRKFATTQGIQIEQRLDAWTAGLDGALDRPLGYGPGRFVEVSAPRTTLRLAKASPDTLYVDAHNILVEHLGTLGVPGLVAFVAFLGLIGYPARGQFLWFAVGLLLVYLMQPQSFSTMPLVFLALGAAGPVVESSRSPRQRLVRGALVVAAVGIGGVLLVGDFFLRQADLDFRVADARSASAWLRVWPEAASKSGQVHFFNATAGRSRGDEDQELLEEAEKGLREAADRDPAVPNHWSNLADLQLYRGHLDEARDSFAAALDRNPYSVRALIGLAAVERLDGNYDNSESHVDAAARIIPRDLVQASVERRTGR